MKSCPRTLGTLFALAVAAATAAPVSADHKRTGPFCKAEQPYVVRVGEETVGDRYVIGNSISIDGVHRGDLFGWTPKFTVDGEVTGDLFALGTTVDVSGVVGDSARVFGQNVDIDGRIEGDLLVFAMMLNVKDGARVTGDVFGSAAHFNLLGDVDGNVQVTTGESTIDGHVGGDLRIKADTITLGEHASIGGNLIYTSRTELPDDAKQHVAGEIVHKEVVDDEHGEEGKSRFSARALARWAYWPVAGFIVGAVLLGVAGRHKLLPVRRLDEEGWTGLAIGLFALPVLAVASVVAVILVLTIPLGIIGLFLLVALAFAGKIPAAIWVGRKILGLRGGEPSPYLSLALGMLIVHLLFSIPYYIGHVLWYVATSAGIGALILALVAVRQSGRKTAAEA